MSKARNYDAEHASKLGELMKKHGASPDRVAARILRAARWNRSEIRVGFDSHFTAFMQRFLPGLLPWILGRTYPLLQSKKVLPADESEP